MQTTIKTILPSLVFLILGMLFFLLLRSFSFPPIVGRFVFSVFATVCLYYLSKVFLGFEKIPLSAVHLVPNKATLMRLGIGIMIGMTIVGIMLIVLFNLTDLGIERVENQTLLLFLLAAIVFIPLALMEELLFRGYPFFRLLQLINIRWVLLITATLFALYHYNSTQNIGSLLLGPGIWGVAFGVAAYLSKSIAVSLGMHISANFLQALFGLKTDYTSMWAITKTADPSNIGIDPELIGLIMQLFLLVVSIVILELFIKSKYSKRSEQE